MTGRQRAAKSLSIVLLGAILGGCASSALQCGDETCTAYRAGIAGTAGLSGGSASYHISINVPPGRGDMAPSVSVGYSSSSGRSVLGMGWYLSEGSSVFRCGATEAMDGYSEGVRYDQASDKLCLGGSHLVPVKGQYGRSGTVYRTMTDEFAQVREYGDMSDPASYFVATYQNGNKWYYKNAIARGGLRVPLYWYVSYAEDTTNNVVSYSYSEPTSGQTLVSEIRYTGREVNGRIEPGTRWVRFNYQPRPDNSIWFLAGGEERLTERLKSIVTGIDGYDNGAGAGQKILEYSFSYTQSVNTGRSLLSAIRECVYDDAGKRTCLEPTTADWIDDPLTFMDPAPYGVPAIGDADRKDWSPATPQVELAPYTANNDYDGDGSREILFYKIGVAPHLYKVDIHAKLVKDIDLSPYVRDPSVQWTGAIGRDIRNIGGGNVVGESHGRLSVMAWKGTGLGDAVTTDIPFSRDMLIGDFDGSSQQDVLQSEADGDSYVVRLYRNEHSTPSRLAFSKPIEILRLPNRPARDLHLDSVGDLDGNGAKEAFVMEGHQILKIVFFHQNSDGSVRFLAMDPSAYGIADRAQQKHIYFADINGDGLNDIVYSDDLGHPTATWRYQLNTGAGFAAPVDTGVTDERGTEAAKTSTIAADIDTDGKDELLYPDKLIEDYCLPIKRAAAGSSGYECSSDGLAKDQPAFDFGIYQFAVLKFVEQPDGKLVPKVIDSTNIIAQANLLSAGDLQGDGITDILSPFDRWFADGRFREKSGKMELCPDKFGCGLQVASSVSTKRDDRQNAAPDMVAKIDHGNGKWESWNCYPLTNPVRALYSVPAMDSPERFLDAQDFFFTSSMYVTGEYTQHAGGVFVSKMEYGGGVYNSAGRGVAGFRWLTEVQPSAKIKYVSWYEQSYPFWGEERSFWSESDSAKGDDYLHGTPDPHYYSRTAYDLDCQGPRGQSDSVKWKCVDSQSPSYHVRQRGESVMSVDQATGTEVITGGESYDYDLFGHQTCKIVQDGKGGATVTELIYAPADIENWWINKLQEKRITTVNKAATCNGKDARSGSTGDLQSDTTYEYNDQRLIKRETEIDADSDSHRTAKLYDYYEDPSSPLYGNLKTVQFGFIGDDGKFELTDERTVKYAEDGYFITSVVDSQTGITTYDYDPKTGNLLKKTMPDGKTEIRSYDPFGGEK